MKTEQSQESSGDKIAYPQVQHRGSLKRRLLVSLLVVTLLPLIVVSAVGYYSAKESMLEAAYASLDANIEEKAAFIKNWFRYRFLDLESHSNDVHNTSLLVELGNAQASSGKTFEGFVKSYQWQNIVDEKAEDLKTFCKLHEYYDFYLIDAQGNILFSIAEESDLGTNLFEGPLAKTHFATACQQTLESGRPAFSDLEYYAPSDDAIAGFLADVIVNEYGDKIGVFAIQITPEQIDYLMQGNNKGKGGIQTYIIGYSPEKDGVTLRTTYYTSGQKENTTASRVPKPNTSSNFLSQIIDTEQTRLWIEKYIDGDEEEEVEKADINEHDEYAFTYLGPSGEQVLGMHATVVLGQVIWGVIAEIPEQVAFAPAAKLGKFVMGLVIVTGLLVVIIAVFVIHRVFLPITQLTNAATRIARGGDLTQNIAVDGKDEIGELARCFNWMVSSLSKLFTEHSSLKFALNQHAIISVTDIRGNITLANDKFCKISGYTREELIGQNHRIVRSDEHSHKFYRDMWKTIAQGQVWSGEIKNRAKHGSHYWVYSSIVPVKNEAGNITQYIAIRTDITERKEHDVQLREINNTLIDALEREKVVSGELEQANEKLKELASTDMLTGLPNRTLFLDRLDQILKQSKRSGGRFAVLFFDFDRFKLINDSLGHDMGDELLCDIADIFRGNLRESDTVARFGGDEFVVLLANISDWSDARIKADKLLEIFAEPHSLHGRQVVSTASIGLVTNKRAYTSADEMIRDADAAMYQAKEAGKGRVVEFDHAMYVQSIDRLVLEEDLRNAVEEKQFHLVYQPIVSLETGEMSGFEALVRWIHPTRGIISPVEFIPIAEETGLINDIGRWVLRNAVKQIADWNNRLGLDHRILMSVNLSKYELLSPSIIGYILECQSQYNLQPGDLKIEVTESTIVDEQSEVIPVLRELRDLGFPIAMDDFGTGLSSLGALHNYPIDVLKIDQSFISALDNDRSLLAVVASITTLADNLGITTVAEGIETEEVVGALQSVECTMGQGYYFAKPMSSTDAEAYLLDLDQKRSHAA